MKWTTQLFSLLLAVFFLFAVLLTGCASGGTGVIPDSTKGKTGKMSNSENHRNVIYLAGGCFWGLEHLMESISGVIDATSGYANGTCEADAGGELQLCHALLELFALDEIHFVYPPLKNSIALGTGFLPCLLQPRTASCIFCLRNAGTRALNWVQQSRQNLL